MHQRPVWPAAAAAEVAGRHVVVAVVVEPVAAVAVVMGIQVGIHRRHRAAFDPEDLVSQEEDLDLEGIAVLAFVADLDLEDIAVLVFAVRLLATEFVEEVGTAEVWLRDMGWTREAVATVVHTD